MSHNYHANIVLASSSKSRQAVLQQTGIRFQQMASNIDEAGIRQSLVHESFTDQSLRLAEAKAKSVSAQYPNHWIIGGDQICACDQTIFEKPKTVDRAISQLQALQGQSHQLYTAICLVHNQTVMASHVAIATLTMIPLSTTQIKAYIECDKPLDACGSYYFESKGIHLFRDVSGAKDVIQGLPLIPLLKMLRNHKVLSFAECLGLKPHENNS